MPNECNRLCVLSMAFGVANLFVPFGANYVSKFMGKTEIGAFNSNMLMILSLLIIVFLAVSCIGHMNNRNNRFFFLTAIMLVINLIVFVYNFATFITL
jgi:hypothetical protein